MEVKGRRQVVRRAPEDVHVDGALQVVGLPFRPTAILAGAGLMALGALWVGVDKIDIYARSKAREEWSAAAATASQQHLTYDSSIRNHEERLTRMENDRAEVKQLLGEIKQATINTQQQVLQLQVDLRDIRARK